MGRLPLRAGPPDAGLCRRPQAVRACPGSPGMRPQAAAGQSPGQPPIELHSFGRQSHREARSQHVRRAVGAGRTDAVLEPQPAAMGLDDLLGDREAEPRILAEVLMRAIGVETVENLVERVGVYTWTVV